MVKQVPTPRGPTKSVTGLLLKGLYQGGNEKDSHSRHCFEAGPSIPQPHTLVAHPAAHCGLS